MALFGVWDPSLKGNWDIILYTWQFFPVVTVIQWCINWYGAGKTSNDSRFNLPGRAAWMTMECWGVVSLFYMLYHVPSQVGLDGIGSIPWENKAMAGMFTVHYLYRAIISPLLNPSMSPIHIIVWLAAILFQIVNGIAIGGWLGGYGYKTRLEWRESEINYRVGGRMELGMMIWALGLAANIFHDDELREIRRAVARSQASAAQQRGEKNKGAKGVDKVYMVPRNGLFEMILFPHYLCEWVEWAGFWLMGGARFGPGRIFLVNEITTMLPRALQGKRWYVERFGQERLEGRKAIIPWLL